MKKYLSLFMVITMVLQSAPVLFAGGTPIIQENGKGGGNEFYLLDVAAPISQAAQNTGQGSQSGQITNQQRCVKHGINKCDCFFVNCKVHGKKLNLCNCNSNQQSQQSGQNGQGGNTQVQTCLPSAMGNYQNMVVINGLGNLNKYLEQCNQTGYPVQCGQAGQSGQQQQGQQQCIPNNGREMTDWEKSMLQEQVRYDRQKELMMLQHQWAQDSEDKKLAYIQQQQLQQEAIKRQEMKQQQNMMLMQMFGGVFSMAIMTQQQNKNARQERESYEREAQRNREYYANLAKYRSRYPQQTNQQSQSWFYDQSSQYGQYK